MYSTLKQTALIFYPFEPFTVQHCQLTTHFLEHKTTNTRWFLECPASPQILQESQHSIIFCLEKAKFFFLLGPQCFICFCSSGNKANPPGLRRPLQHNMPFLSTSSPKMLSGIFAPHALMLCTTVNWAALWHLSSKSPPLPKPPAQDHWLPAEHIHPCLIFRVSKQ